MLFTLKLPFLMIKILDHVILEARSNHKVPSQNCIEDKSRFSTNVRSSIVIVQYYGVFTVLFTAFIGNNRQTYGRVPLSSNGTMILQSHNSHVSSSAYLETPKWSITAIFQVVAVINGDIYLKMCMNKCLIPYIRANFGLI